MTANLRASAAGHTAAHESPAGVSGIQDRMPLCGGGTFTVNTSKKELRKMMLAARAAVFAGDRKRWDAALTDRFLALPEIRGAEQVFCYLSYGTEIDTKKLIHALFERGVRVSCPRVGANGQDMDFYEIHSLTDCIPGFRGIPEPGQGCKKAAAPDAPVLLPGLAFTENGERLGYGGGFYDRFLSREPAHFTAALAYPFQILPALPTDAHDRRADAVLTPERVILPG